MSLIITSDKVVEIMMPKNGHVQGQILPDVYVCIMALDLAMQIKATEIRVHAPNEFHPRVYSIRQVMEYLWTHPELQHLKGLGTVGPGPGRANFGTGQHIVSPVVNRQGIPIPVSVLRRWEHKKQQKLLTRPI